ncbi:TadE-like protein [Rosistilla oblonga]|uniref:TadE family protein n=1 Tax=Rosistilla oblonga TaxID=2527990 RepID=UPI0011899578|nr:TadE family protein [Rosistilla oblonga]QDV11805.1 TadE-like protein [Rosistilla oblonga]
MYRSNRKSQRTGAAVVEMAICLPVLIALTVATIDVCSVMFLKESLSIAAYEGARVGVARGGTNAQATARVKEILDERGITYNDGNVVQIQRTDSPTNGGFNSAETLEHCRILVQVPASGNVLSPAKLFTSGNIQSFVWMRKEYENID